MFSNTNDTLGSAVATLTVLSGPKFGPPVLATNGQIILSWVAAPGRQYQLQFKTNLSQGNWINLGNPVTATENRVTVTNAAGLDPQRFFRLQQQ